MKDKAQRSKTSKRMDGVIRKLEDEGHKQEHLLPMIHMGHAMVANTESEASDDDDVSESSNE